VSAAIAQPGLFDSLDRREGSELISELREFRSFGTASREAVLSGVPVFANEYWTSKQRDAHSLHEVSYRACFKPQLPAFFVERFTELGGTVYDPFMGRGTTLVEASLHGRNVWGNDINPLSRMLVEPRLNPPHLCQVVERLREIDLTRSSETPADLLVFYHPDTLAQIAALRDYLLRRQADEQLDPVDRWIRMVAMNRLTGHSRGFFSVYTLPPNQAVSVASQQRINERRKQVPPKRNVIELIVRKSKSLLTDIKSSAPSGKCLGLLNCSADATYEIPEGSVDLTVTSPPFLDIVNYSEDNWLRCWFAGIDPKAVQISIHRKLEEWTRFISDSLGELARVTKPGGYIAFEVGEVRNRRILLEEAVLAAAEPHPLRPVAVMINEQDFTKTAHCWGVSNNTAGTNSNRIVVLERTGRPARARH
jgi:hypothetical protein